MATAPVTGVRFLIIEQFFLEEESPGRERVNEARGRKPAEWRVERVASGAPVFWPEILNHGPGWGHPVHPKARFSPTAFVWFWAGPAAGCGMAHFPKPDSGSHRSPASTGEFFAPAGPVRLRGTAERPAPAAAPVRPAEREPAAPALPGSRSGPARDELKICGLAAVRARFARDPNSIIRLFFDLERSRQVGVMSKVLAQAKKIYRCVEPAELEKIAGSMHHGGIVAVVAPAPLRAPTVEDLRAWARRGEALLVLDRIVPRDLPAICVSPCRPSFPLTTSD